MRSRLQRDFSNEDGVSLVEMLVSLLIIGTVLAALANTMISSSAAVRSNEGLTQATQIATEALEDLQALPWAKVGLYDNDGPAWTSTAMGGLPTVSLGPVVSPRDPLVPFPQRDVIRAGTTYRVTTQIVWAGGSRRKQFRVAVSWTSAGAARNLELQGKRAKRAVDAGAASIAPPGFRSTAFTVNPEIVYLDGYGRTVKSTNPDLGSNYAFVLRVQASEAASSVVVTWAPSQSATLTQVAGSNGMTWEAFVPQTAPSGAVHAHGTNTFTATLTKAGSTTTATDTSQATFLWAVTRGATTINTRTVTGTATYPGGDYICTGGSPRRMTTNLNLVVDLTGVTDADVVMFERTDSSGVTRTVQLTPVQAVSGGWRFSGSVTPTQFGTVADPATTKTTTFDVKWQRLADSGTGAFPISVWTTGGTPC